MSSDERNSEKLQLVILRCDKLLKPGRETSIRELKGLRQSALDALYSAGHDGTHIYRQIEGLDFHHLVYQDQMTALVAHSSRDLLFSVTDRMLDNVGIQKCPRHIQRALYRALLRLKELLILAIHSGSGRAYARPVQPLAAGQIQQPVHNEAKESIAMRKAHRRRRRLRNFPKAQRTATSRRARTVARLLGELDTLKPQMESEEDYGALAARHKRFMCFRIARRFPDLRTKLENLQAHRQHVRLAQELAAAHHGVSLATAQTDWKRHKPDQFRKCRSKSKHIPKNPQKSPLISPLKTPASEP